MTILTLTDFQVKPYVIPNQTDTAGAVNPFITEQVDNLLVELLGSPFYNALKAGIEALPADWSSATTYALDALVVSGTKIYKSLQAANTNHAVSDPLWWVEEPENKWLLLKIGNTYLHEGREYTWGGLKKLLKPAVYSKYLTDFPTDQTGVGTIVSNSENADVVSPDRLITNAWNVYDKLAAGGTFICDLHIDTFYGYLFAKREDFDEDVTGKGYDDFEQYLNLNFESPGNLNVFDL